MSELSAIQDFLSNEGVHGAVVMTLTSAKVALDRRYGSYSDTDSGYEL